MRSLLPAATVLLVLIGVLRWQAQREGWFGTTVGIMLLTGAAIAMMAGLMFVFSYRLERNEAQRRLADEQLRHSARYFELSQDLICTAGLDGYFKQLNAAWTETLGWSEAELCSRPFVEFVHPDDREATERATARMARGEAVDIINRYATKHGGWRWFDWKAKAVLEEAVIYASARDVTQHKVAELALEASELQTRLILESAHDAFVAADSDGVITEWNSKAEVSFGWSRREAVGRALATTILPEAQRDAHRDRIERFLATGQRQVLGERLELTALHRDGREFPIELTISPLKTRSGYTFNAFLRDITERNRAQLELAFARDEALESSRLKSMFVANVSHEIRTPMNGVIGMSELLLDTDLDEWQREYAETISSSGDTLLGIIDDILDFSKIEAGKLELDRTDVDLRHAVERACGMLAARAHKKGLELLVTVDADVPSLVHADAARLRQVIANLVLNAIKFTPAGEIVVRARSSPSSDGGALVRLEVSDTGIGIEPATLQRLFVPFAQADSSTTRTHGGTGLGLAISRQLIELMGGKLGATSVHGKGSTFWFELTLERAQRKLSAPDEEHELAGLRVLVVDDNASSREILARQLGSLRMSCEAAGTAAQALERLAAAADDGIPYQLALIDWEMPGADGFELAGAIRRRPQLTGIRLLLLGSSGGVSDAPGEPLHGFDGLLTKPVRQSRLYEEIRAVITGEQRVPRRRERPAAAPADGPRRTLPDVLVVEDTPVNQAVAARMLEKAGFLAHIVANGREALEVLAEKSFAAVLMDCQMPELDGYETTREIRRREQGRVRVPIIAMTANSMQGERERCLAAGMDDYLSKPLRNRVLKDALTRWTKDASPTAEASATRPVRPASDPQLLDEVVLADLESLDGDPLPGLLALYFDQAAERLSELGDGVSSGAAVTVGKAAHMLKGSSLTIGAAYVARVAADLEAAAEAGELGVAGPLREHLRGALDETAEAFRQRAQPSAEKRIGSVRPSLTR